MRSQPVSLRIPEPVRAAIDETVRRTGRDFSSVANEMLAEAVKMRRIPGIVFADGLTRRVVVMSGTGVEVWEVIRCYREVGESWNRLREAYHWLSEHQLRAALAYGAAYPEEIEERLMDEERWTPEAVWVTYPFTRPPGR